jgi:L-amino acid N-acyltransferase YncA
MVEIENITSFNIDEISSKLKIAPAEVLKVVEAFSKREISISDVGLEEIDSKILYVWKKQGLLPFYEENSKKRIWWRFSFIEICWLKVLVELRKVGIGMQKLQELTEFFYPEHFIEEYIKNAMTNTDSIAKFLPEGFYESQQEKKGEKYIEIALRKLFEELRISRFSLLIHAIILEKANYALYFDEKKNFQILDIDEIDSANKKDSFQLRDLLQQHTIVFLNIRKVVADLSQSHEYFSKKTEIIDRISESSIEHLRKQFEANGVHEVTIRSNASGRPTLYVTRKMNFTEMGKAIADMKKSGTFRDVVIKSRDGRIKYFELTELIKL